MKKSIVRIIALALISVMMCLALVSCGGPNADPDKAVEALKKNDYAAEKVDDSGLGALIIAALKVAGIEDVDCVVSGTADVDGKTEHITIIYFEDKEAADEEWEDVQKYAEDEKGDEDSDWVVEKSGKMIYFGTKAAVKAAK